MVKIINRKEHKERKEEKRGLQKRKNEDFNRGGRKERKERKEEKRGLQKRKNEDFLCMPKELRGLCDLCGSIL